MRLATVYVTIGIISVGIFDDGQGQLDTFPNRYDVSMISVFHMLACMFSMPLGSQFNVGVYFALIYTKCVIVCCNHVAVIAVITAVVFVCLIFKEVLSIISYFSVTKFVGVVAAIVIDQAFVGFGNWFKVYLSADASTS